jgi:hypothetical protein
MHIKRGLVFALSLFLIIGLVALVASLEIAGPATWRDKEGNNITGEIITINLSQGIPSGDYTYNMFVEGITGVLSGEDYVTFELWEKDSHEGGGDDPLRTHDLGNEITGSYSSGQAFGSWILALSDFDLAGIEEDGIYEMFYKMIIGPEGATPETRGSAVGVYDNILLNFKIIWPGSMVNPILYWWGGPYSSGGITEPGYPPIILDTRIIDAQNLFNSNDNRLSNVIYPVLEGIEIPEGEQSVAYFEIWADSCDNRDYPIRVEENAIPAVVVKGDALATAPWFISFEDILKSSPHCEGSSCHDQSEISYRYTFDATFAGQGGICIENPPIVDVFIDWSNFSFSERWLDKNAGLEVTNLDLVTADLGTEESKAYIEITGLPAGTLPNGETGSAEGMEVYVELWELDNSHDWFSLIGEDLDGDGIDDAIRTVANGRALTGIVDSTGKVLVPIIFTENDFLGHEKEQTYEFHFTLSFVGTKGQIIPIPHGDNLLRVSLDGEVQGCDVSGASGDWRNFPSGIPIGDTLMTFDPFGQSILKVVPFSYNLPCEEGTPVIIEIYEHDAGTDNDAIRTIDPSTGEPLYGTVNANGEVSALWTITQEDMDAALAGGENDDIYEFYFKIIVGQGEKDFSDEILYVQKEEDSCVSVNYCWDYFTLGDCNADGCEVANDTGLTFNPPIECELLGLNCWCGWNNVTSSCEFAFNNPSDPPSPFNDQCQFIDDSGTDTCEDDGYLSFTWAAQVIWDPLNSYATQQECIDDNAGTFSDCILDQGAWRYDPGMILEDCISGGNTLICPTKVQLSFWDWRNLVIVILILVIIYLVVEYNKKNKIRKSK